MASTVSRLKPSQSHRFICITCKVVLCASFDVQHGIHWNVILASYAFSRMVLDHPVPGVAPGNQSAHSRSTVAVLSEQI